MSETMIDVWGWTSDWQISRTQTPKNGARFDADGEHLGDLHGRWFSGFQQAKRAALADLASEIEDYRKRMRAVRALRKGDVG